MGLRKVGVGKTEAACSTAWVSHCLLLQRGHPNLINTSMTKEDRSPVLITSASKALLWDCFELVHRSVLVFKWRAAGVSDECLLVSEN